MMKLLHIWEAWNGMTKVLPIRGNGGVARYNGTLYGVTARYPLPDTRKALELLGG